jgi:hypothetical protein
MVVASTTRTSISPWVRLRAGARARVRVRVRERVRVGFRASRIRDRVRVSLTEARRRGLEEEAQRLPIAAEAAHGVVGVDEAAVVREERRRQITRHNVLALGEVFRQQGGELRSRQPRVRVKVRVRVRSG